MKWHCLLVSGQNMLVLKMSKTQQAFCLCYMEEIVIIFRFRVLNTREVFTAVVLDLSYSMIWNQTLIDKQLRRVNHTYTCCLVKAISDTHVTPPNFFRVYFGKIDEL